MARTSKTDKVVYDLNKTKCLESPTKKHKYHIQKGTGKVNTPVWECEYCNNLVRST